MSVADTLILSTNQPTRQRQRLQTKFFFFFLIHAGNSTGNHVKAVSDMKSGSFGMGLQYLLRKQQFEEDSDAIRNDERN